MTKQSNKCGLPLHSRGLANRLEYFYPTSLREATLIAPRNDGVTSIRLSMLLIDFFRNSTSAGDLYVDAVLESSRTLEYAAVLRSASPSNP
ncbi:hypothetical protein [Candidatus Tisiphia endosymbiont of Psammoecus bipunctatus]